MTLAHRSLLALLLAVPTVALTHPGHAESSLMAGLTHPLFGLDHLLAMLAVGLWAAQQQGAARWALPLTFVTSMVIGGMLGFGRFSVPLLETGITGSLVALGLLVALALRPALPVAVGLVALFAAAHGIAHGLEAPAQGVQAAYSLGFVAATAALHAAGFTLVRLLPLRAAPLVKWLGAASAIVGVWLMAGWGSALL